MDSKLYKWTKVQRGHTYRYFYAPPSPDKPVLLFLHGFPSTSYDWHKQVAHFQPQGYGIFAPDCLGAGGSDKPLDVKEFCLDAMAGDIMDILKAEGISKVVAVAHDWGAVLLSRVAVRYPETFHGFVWVAVGFVEPIKEPFDIEAAMAFTKSTLGFESYAYWQFFTRPDAYSLIEKNVDSFLQLVYPSDPDCWRSWIVVRDKTAEAIENNVQLGRASWLTEEEYTTLRQTLITDGVRASLLWYNCQAENHDMEASRSIPQEKIKLTAPSLVALAMRDWVCIPAFTKANMDKLATDVEYIECQAGHWVQLQCGDQLNAAMDQWLKKLAI